ncbi:MAG TPA: DNA-primase RepB domain-containing protein, partial [Syntrophobacteraceae bacterium]|nr:DNA-primase RepB domain-containing protein [Syntrophobacteraceae bacterium]
FDDKKRGAVIPRCFSADDPDALFETLAEENRKGAGVFVVVNETTGDEDKDVTAVRALFVDLDGAPLEPITGNAVKPHILIESSPEHYHAYYLVSDCPLERFKPLQRALAKRFNGDNNIVNLSRVMRLPGFLHQKAAPFMTRIISIEEREPYSAQEIVRRLQLDQLLDDRRPERPEVSNGDPPKMTDDEVIGQASRDADFAELFQGRWQQFGYGDKSQSSADLVFFNKLLPHSKSPEQLARIFAASALGQTTKQGHGKIPRCKIESYVERTIRKALEERPIDYAIVEGFKSAVDLKVKATRSKDNQNKTTADFPQGVMSGFLGNFAGIYAECLEPPVQFFFAAALTALGNLLSGRISIDSELAAQPRFYTLLLGQSADDRKSTAIDKTVEFFKRESMDGTFHTCNGVGSAEGLQKKLEGLNPDNDKRKLLLVYDEFKAFVSKCRTESSVLLPCVNTFFEKCEYDNHTKTSKIELHNVHLSLLAASTIDTFQTCWTSTFTDIGFNNRLFIVTGEGERKFSIPPKIAPEKMCKLGLELREIIAFVGNSKELTFTDEARSAYDKWYLNLESSIHTRRLDTYAFRLMLILAANELIHSIDLEIVEKATALCNWQLKIRKLYDPLDCDNVLAKMEEKIRRSLGARALSERELKQRVNAARDGLFAFNTAVRNLMQAGEIVRDKTTGKYCPAMKV